MPLHLVTIALSGAAIGLQGNLDVVRSLPERCRAIADLAWIDLLAGRLYEVVFERRTIALG